MARSIKKGPYVVDSLVRKIETLNRSGEKRVLKTWARRCTILPEFVGHTLAVHNGNKFIPIYVTENMVGPQARRVRADADVPRPRPARGREDRGAREVRPDMQAKAIQRYVRITPRKCNQVLELIRGQSVEQAQTTLQFTPKLGARIVQKVLKSAVANALHEGKVRIEDLYVKEAVVGAGPTLKRWLPRAQGRATPLLKRMSHVSVTVATRE